MSSHIGVSVVNGPSRVGDGENEDSGEDNGHNQSLTLFTKAVRPMPRSTHSAREGRSTMPRSTDPAGEGRSTNVEQLVRPALPGRKVYRKTFTEDNRGMCREENHKRDEEKLKTEHRERGKIRQRRMDRTDTCGNKAQVQQERGSNESSCSSNSDVLFNSILEAGEGSNNSQRGNTCPGPQEIGFTQNIISSLNTQFTRPATQPRSTPLSPRRLSSRLAVEDLHRYSFGSSRDPDQFWMEVRTRAASGRSSQSHQSHAHIPPLTPSEPEEEEDENEENVDDEEDGSGVLEVMSQAMTSVVVPPCIPFGERRMRKREKNRIKSLRRRQRRREKWRQNQQQESRQSSTGNPTTSSSSSSSSSEDDEALSTRDRDGLICAVCLDVYFNPYICHPCNHIFCEPCLRTLAKNSSTNTPCPLCRTIITHVFFQKELNQTARTFFPKEYLSRKQSFQKASCAKWPLPSSRKLFRIFGGFQRQSSPIGRRQFPHGGGYRLDTMDFEDDSRGWRFDMDMVIIYIYSVNWVIGFFIFCFLCYLFFPSF